MENRLNLLQAFHFNHSDKIAFVGAGGKTTALFQLAREFNDVVLITTTTHLGTWQTEYADKHWIVSDKSEIKLLTNKIDQGIHLITGPVVENDRVSGLSLELMDSIRDLAEELKCPLLIEADGARQKPIKAPAAHEPVIPNWVSHVVVVAGLQVYMKPLTSNWVHRPELFAGLSDIKIGELIKLREIKAVLSHENGGLKGIPLSAQRYLLINQADDDLLQAVGGHLASDLLQVYSRVGISSLRKKGVVYASYHPVAGVILAAGASLRYKTPKQLLPWHGGTFISQVVNTALISGLDPVEVIVGAYQSEVVEALRHLPVKVIINSNWQSGQSSSVIIGIDNLTATSGGAIFIMADQPQISVSLIRSLVECAYTSGKPAIMPLINGQRSTPVYFSRETFYDLQRIEGDEGGRALFPKYHPEYIEWVDSLMALDVDNLEDYAKLLENE
ncbi:MAG: selenium cofactor biosynthesis protein YqeC [Chloroflexota bacterium]